MVRDVQGGVSGVFGAGRLFLVPFQLTEAKHLPNVLATKVNDAADRK